MNCLMQALASKNCELVWFDKRKEISSESIDLDSFGFILNTISNFSLGFVSLPIKNRHWISLRKLDDCNFYNLDSKLSGPKLIGGNDDFIEHLKKEMESNDKELFIVVRKS